MYNVDTNLMVFALRNYNENFLKYALKTSIFGISLLSTTVIIDEFLNILRSNTKNELVLNCLNYADFTRWPQKRIRSFIQQVTEIIKRPRDRNRILLCYNPILVISLCCEFLIKIGNNIQIFHQESRVISTKLQKLGEKIVDQMDESVIARVYTEVDFRERTVLKIITSNGFVPLMMDPKVSILLEEIWAGNSTYECDGKLTDFSSLTYLLISELNKKPGETVYPLQLVTNGFTTNIEQ
jgi:hypothetical protein